MYIAAQILLLESEPLLLLHMPRTASFVPRTAHFVAEARLFSFHVVFACTVGEPLRRRVHPLLNHHNFRLAVWPLSGSLCSCRIYQKGCLRSYWLHGKKELRNNESAWKQFCRWCHKKSVNPFSCHLDSILPCLSDLYEKGLQYKTINSHRSAISMTHLPIDNVCAGAHPLVSRLMKGIFNLRPAVPKYLKTWDVSVVLKYLISLSPAPFLSLKKLILKLVMIMATIKAFLELIYCTS